VNVQNFRFPLIDSIRAIALVAVIAAHSSFFMARGGSTSLSHLHFDFSVRVFFMISAFLLYARGSPDTRSPRRRRSRGGASCGSCRRTGSRSP
jgi:peptidoglycan/LPS O-acetylase OafA/YrhL